MQTLPLDACELPVEALVAIRERATAAGVERFDWASLSDPEVLGKLDDFVGNRLDDTIASVRSTVEDPYKGISVLDIPELSDCPRTEDMWAASVAALLIARRLSPLRIDSTTKRPFTIYNASSRGEEALIEKGIKYYSPEQNLGFHTDGIVRDGALWSPRYVSIYNVYFGYRQPGNFFWVPFARWNQFDEWKRKLSDRKFRLEITPITYRNPSGELIVTSDGQYVVSLLSRSGQITVPFFNGEVIGCESDPSFDMGEIRQMLASLSTNPARFGIPLRARRLFVLNNWLGAHARDIFKDPLEGVKYTRSFFRAMSQEMLSV